MIKVKKFVSLLGKQDVSASMNITDSRVFYIAFQDDNSFSANTAEKPKKGISFITNHKYLTCVKTIGNRYNNYLNKLFVNGNSFTEDSEYSTGDFQLCVSHYASDITTNQNFGVACFKDNTTSASLTVDYALILDLTALGLDTLTAQQFYEKYSSIFADVAGNKLSDVKKIYTRKFKSMLGNQTNNTIGSTSTASTVIMFNDKNIYYAWRGSNNPFNLSIVDGHKYFVYVKMKNIIDVRFVVYMGDQQNNIYVGSNKYSQTKPTSREIYAIISADKNCDFKNLWFYYNGNYPDEKFSSSVDLVDYYFVVDMTKEGVDNLTEQQFYDRYKTLFVDIASDKLNKVYSKIYVPKGAFTSLVGKQDNLEVTQVSASYKYFSNQHYGAAGNNFVSGAIPIVNNHKYLLFILNLQTTATNFNTAFIDNYGGDGISASSHYRASDNTTLYLFTSNLSTSVSRFAVYLNTSDVLCDGYGFIDLTANNLDTLTAQQVYDKYKGAFKFLASGKPTMFEVYDRLPNDYQRVEYIATDSNSYINTGFIPDISKTYDFYGKFYFNERGDQVILGTRKDTGNTRYFPFAVANSNEVTKTNIGYTVYNYGDDVITLNVAQEYQTHFEQRKQTWGLVNGNLKTTSMFFDDDFTFTKPMHLFRANHTSPSACRNKTRCYYIKAYENNKLVLDLIPCYRKSDNVIGVYESISGTFLTNAGTGAFSKGPDVN